MPAGKSEGWRVHRRSHRALVKSLSSALGTEQRQHPQTLGSGTSLADRRAALERPECSRTDSGAGIKGTIRGRGAADGSSGAQCLQL